MPTTTLSTTESVPFPAEVFEPTSVRLLDTKDSEELPLTVNFRDLADADRSKIKPRKVYRSSEIFKYVFRPSFISTDISTSDSRCFHSMELKYAKRSF